MFSLGVVLFEIRNKCVPEWFPPEGMEQGALIRHLGGLTRGAVKTVMGYWVIIGLARTAGTAIGDWIAESRIFNIGLPVATLIAAAGFVAVLLLWRPKTAAAPVS